MLHLRRHGHTWQMHDPGGRVGKFLREGRPYEYQLLDEVHARGLTGSAIDVGAHVGNHSIFLAVVCGLRVYAFEPHPDSFAQLLANVRANDALVSCHREGCGAQPGRARLGSRMRLHDDPAGTVRVVRLDDALGWLDDVAVVKVDVEGAEHLVLAGAAGLLARCRPIVYAETHSRTAGRLTAAVLEPLGYRSTGVVRMGSSMERWEAR